nr:FAD-dependent monooxygenase [Anaerolineae bacterium]
MSDYDVIIIGGRPAGSSLAARLGRQGIRTLLLERETFPSLPAVSSPIIHSSTLTLLDEIGADEAIYAHNTPKIRRMIQVLGPETAIDIVLPDHQGRDYGYAVDRARFDEALWDHAAQFPSVTAWQGFSVTDLLWENDTVIGIIGRDADKTEHRLTAGVVIGADGRYSLVARKTEAAIRDEYLDYPSTIYYAYWRDVQPYDDGEPTAVGYAGEGGCGYLLMDSADHTTAVVIEGQSALFENADLPADQFYAALLDRHPLIRARLAQAERVTSVRGIKRVGNLYRQAGGKGWALIGDAYHQKDPLDGQGIYNAVFSAKAMAYAIQKWRAGEFDWLGALAWYDETVRIKTYAMYKNLLGRVQASLYAPPPPPWAVKILGD